MFINDLATVELTKILDKRMNKIQNANHIKDM